jgi:hypothetical protein
MVTRPEPQKTFGLMLRALLADVPKKNSWGLAEHAGLPTPHPFEHLLDGAVWDADERPSNTSRPSSRRKIR